MKKKIAKIIIGLFLINIQVFGQDSIVQTIREIEYKKDVYGEYTGPTGPPTRITIRQWRYIGSENWEIIDNDYTNLLEPLGIFPESALLIKQAHKLELANRRICVPAYMVGGVVGILCMLKLEKGVDEILIDDNQVSQDASQIKKLKIACYTGFGFMVSGLIANSVCDIIGKKKMEKAIDVYNENVRKGRW